MGEDGKTIVDVLDLDKSEVKEVVDFIFDNARSDKTILDLVESVRDEYDKDHELLAFYLIGSLSKAFSDNMKDEELKEKGLKFMYG